MVKRIIGGGGKKSRGRVPAFTFRLESPVNAILPSFLRFQEEKALLEHRQITVVTIIFHIPSIESLRACLILSNRVLTRVDSKIIVIEGY